MKKCRFFSILSFLLVVLLTLGVFAGCTNDKQSDDVEPTLNENDSDILYDAYDMEAVFDGIICAMRSANSDYMPTSQEFIWSSIYIMVANYGYDDANIKIVEDGSGYIVKADTIKYYASAISSEKTDLTNVPKDLGIVENTDGGYLVTASEPGDSYIGIEGAQANSDNTVSAYVALIENDTLVCEYVFTLVPNSAATIGNGPIFKYTVSSVKLITEDVAVITDIETEDGETYATLDYVELVYHKANNPDDLDLNGNMYQKDTVYIKNDSEESTKLLVDEDSFLVMGDIFGSQADFKNVFASKDYFTANCVKEYKNEPLYFKVNKLGEKLLSATLWYQYYLG